MMSCVMRSPSCSRSMSSHLGPCVSGHVRINCSRSDAARSALSPARRNRPNNSSWSGARPKRPRTLAPTLRTATDAELGVRGVLELSEQAGDDEGGLLADVDRVVADALDAARHEHH